MNKSIDADYDEFRDFHNIIMQTEFNSACSSNLSPYSTQLNMNVLRLHYKLYNFFTSKGCTIKKIHQFHRSLYIYLSKKQTGCGFSRNYVVHINLNSFNFTPNKK